MISNSYREYLRSPRWQKKRQEVFAYYGKRCYACKTTRGPIQVHHLSYDRFGNEKISDLLPLCSKCHKFTTAFHRKHRRNGLAKNTAIAISLIQKTLRR